MSSSNLKSASFNLQKIIDFYRAKTVEHGSIVTYLELVKAKDNEVLEFLDKVIMNRHRFEIAKQRFLDDANNKASWNGTIRVVLIVINVLVGVAILGMVIAKSNLLQSDASLTARLRTIIVTVIVLLSLTIAFYLSINYAEHRKADYEGAKMLRNDAERFFEKFENKLGVAMFYGLKFKFTEPQGPDKRVIKPLYDDLVTANGSRPAQKLSVQDVRNNPEWPKIVDECRPEYIAAMQTTTNRDAQTQRELEALAKEEDTLRLWDNANMLQEIRTKSLALLALVTKTTDTDSDKLNDEDISEVIKKDVIPLFIQRSVVRIQDMALKDASALGLVPLEEFSADTAEVCLLHIQQNPNIHIVVYDADSRSGKAYSEKAFPKNTVFKPSRGSAAFIIENKEDQMVFLEAGPLTTLPKEPISEAQAKTTDCVTECFDDPSCVGFSRRRGLCTLNLAMERPPFDTVELNCRGDADCTTYKFDVKEIGRTVDRITFFDDAKSALKTRLVDTLAKYNYEITLLKYIDLIRNELDVVYANNEIDTVMVKVTEILELAEFEARNAIKSMTTKFISFDKFEAKLDGMTLGELMHYHQNVLLKLHNVVYILHEKVQDGLANNTSIDRNMFVDKERALHRQSVMVWSIVAIIGLAYSLYILRVIDDPDMPSAGERAVTLIMPMVVILLIVAILVSNHRKQASVYWYNRGILEANDTKLLDAIYMLSTSVEKVVQQENKSVRIKVKDLSVRQDAKRDIYNNALKAINMLERCNLITDASQVLLPFPYVDLTIHGSIILVSVIIVAYMMGYVSPTESVMQIRVVNRVIQLVKDHPGKYSLADFPELECLGPDMTPIKIIAGVVFVVISLMFSNRVLRSSDDYQRGLYNSRYFYESRCVNE